MTFNHLFANLQTRLSREEGQTMAEYGVVLAVITVLCVVAFTTLSGEITNAIDAVSAILPGS
jgi:Flp pilus assembly pilin Flp